jgi:hypothetical protein
MKIHQNKLKKHSKVRTINKRAQGRKLFDRATATNRVAESAHRVSTQLGRALVRLSER